MELRCCFQTGRSCIVSAARHRVTFDERLPRFSRKWVSNRGTTAPRLICTLANIVPSVWGKVREPSEQLRKRAAECFACGTNALTERARRTWLSMAQLWLQLAERAEQAQNDAPTGGTSLSTSPQTS